MAGPNSHARPPATCYIACLLTISLTAMLGFVIIIPALVSFMDPFEEFSYEFPSATIGHVQPRQTPAASFATRSPEMLRKTTPAARINISHNHFLFPAQGPTRRTVERVVIERHEDFSQRMRDLGVAVLTPMPWVNLTKHDNEDWINHTKHLWSMPAFRFSQEVVQDLLSHHEQTFRQLGKAQVDHQLDQGIKALSYYPRMPEVPPSVASFTNVIVHRHGQIQVGSTLFALKGCKVAVTSRAPLLHRPNLARLDRVIVISQYWTDNYYHFMMESLPRLVLVTRLLSGSDDWHVHVMRSKISRLVLPLLGVRENRIVSGDLFATFAIVPEPVPCARCPASMLNLLRRTLLASPLLAAQPNTDRCSVLLLKRKGGARRILNHDELLLTARRGLVSCDVREHSEDVSFSSQLALFRDANAVIAPHGAGLSNMVACKPLTLVVECLVAGREINILYAVMAYKLRLRYIGHSVRQARQDAPMSVSADEVVRLVKTNLSPSPSP